MTISIEDFLTDIPLLHTWDKGKTWNTGGYDASHLRPLRAFLEERSVHRIIETGCGASTIFFLLLGTETVVSIDPKDGVYQRVTAYCESRGIPLARHEMHVNRSELILPYLASERDRRFDLALIDGDHAWPTVFVDFCYCNRMLRRGGLVMIDDIELYSVGELARFLAEEPGFALRLDLGKALVFEKLDDRIHPRGWRSQPYIAQRSFRPSLLRRLKRLMKLG